MRKTGFIWIVLVWSLVGVAAQAGTNDNAKIAAHLQLHSSKSSCEDFVAPPCNQGSATVVVHGNLGTGYDLYLVVLDADSSAGVSAATFGIRYSGASQAGVDIFSWSLCADMEFTGGPEGVAWPDSGSGTIIVWDRTSSCQRHPVSGDVDGGVAALLGMFYVYAYSDDVFAVTKRDFVPTPGFSVCDCRAKELELPFPEARGTVGFGNQSGSDPCQ